MIGNIRTSNLRVGPAFEPHPINTLANLVARCMPRHKLCCYKQLRIYWELNYVLF